MIKKGNISCNIPRAHYFQKRRVKQCTMFLFDNAILLCDGVGDDLQYWTMFEVNTCTYVQWAQYNIVFKSTYVFLIYEN